MCPFLSNYEETIIDVKNTKRDSSLSVKLISEDNSNVANLTCTGSKCQWFMHMKNSFVKRFNSRCVLMREFHRKEDRKRERER